ncbi:MAG: polyprenyl diphosphate synthase, partial [Lactobacillus amylovorus]|nr:polyprenyl diphosphate synthase [Lactobacillus amylovorus]
MSKKDNELNHLAIIMDGNGRWAQGRNQPVSSGHLEGANTLKRITQYVRSLGIPNLTVYAFSKENWNRPAKEVEFLITLLKQYLLQALKEVSKEQTRIKFLGNLNKLDKEATNLIKELEEGTKDYHNFSLNICLSYSGREEIVDATKRIAQDVIDKKIS